MNKMSLVVIAGFMVSTVFSCTTVKKSQKNVIDEHLVQYRYNPMDAQVWPEWYDPGEKDTISVLIWNMYHFVDDYDNPYISHERESNPDENLPERRQKLAEALKILDADIIVFQEVESAQYIKAYADEYIPELGYEVVNARESFDFYMSVVVLSRIPVGNLTSYATITTDIVGFTGDDDDIDRQSFTNNRMWTAEILVNDDYYFYLTGVHLKARGGEHNIGWRIGQINYMRSQYERYLHSDPNARILIAGDLNFQSDAREMDVLLGKGSDIVFIDPVPDPQLLITHPADAPRRQLDHIIPNDKMAADMIAESVFVPEIFDSETMRLISDHLPVIARFVVR